MARHAFSNNAVTTLTAGIDASETTIALADDAAFESDLFEPGLIQALTISSPTGSPSPEVVYAYTRPSANTRYVLRGREGTTAAVWPIGSLVSARVTAGMLGAFPQISEGALLLGSIIGRDWLGSAQVSGFPILQLARAGALSESRYMDSNVSREITGAHIPVNLGTVATWTSGAAYQPFSVVSPSTPDGSQYCFAPSASDSVTQTTTTPPFDTDPEANIEALDSWDDVVGKWIPVTASSMEQRIPYVGVGVLVVTELGFVCTAHGGGSAPVVSIGADSNPTMFASSVSLSQITGAGYVHRIPITSGGAAVAQKLTFSLVTPSSGVFTGRWYWKGMLIQTEMPPHPPPPS